MFILSELLSADAVSAFFLVVVADIALAGDNAVVIALAARGLPAKKRNKAIAVGIVAATVLRIALASIAVQLLNVVGLLLAGGILLLWVCWKMWREMHPGSLPLLGLAARTDVPDRPGDPNQKSFGQAAFQIIIADVSMSLDNVLAVAGAAREHPEVLIFGLALSVALMGFAAVLISNLLQRHHWIAYLGLAVILYVALKMIYEGGHQVLPYAQAMVGG